MQQRMMLMVGAISGLLGVWACSSKSTNDTQTGDSTDPEADGGGNAATPGQDASAQSEMDSGTHVASGSDGGTASGPVNPIMGIAALTEVAPNTELAGGYFDSVRQWNDGGLIFSDPSSGPAGGGILFQFNNNVAQPLRTPSNQSLGSALDKNHALITAESNVQNSAAGRVVRTLADGTYSVVASEWDAGGIGVAFDSPNDVTVRKSDGTIYVTDPGYQNPDAGINHLFRIDATGTARVADSCETLCRPNGIALSPDEKTLYVGFTGPFDDMRAPYIQKYPINADGTLGTSVKFADVGTDLDGLASDDAGNVYAAYKAGIAVFDATGKKWGDIAVAKQPSGVAFGGTDRKTLFIAASSAASPSIYRVQVNIAGRVE